MNENEKKLPDTIDESETPTTDPTPPDSAEDATDNTEQVDSQSSGSGNGDPSLQHDHQEPQFSRNTPPLTEEEFVISEAIRLQLPLPRRKPSKHHNAFRDEPSATEEVVRKKHFLLRGTRPLPGEPIFAYQSRMFNESNFIHNENKLGLRSSATKICLLLVLYIAIYRVLVETVPVILKGYGIIDPNIDLHRTLFTILMYTLLYPISYTVIIYLGNLGETHKVRTFLRKPKCSPAYVLKWFVITAGCSYVVNTLFVLITNYFNYDSGATFEPYTSVLDAVTQFVVICVFAPLFEEILFRGVMLSHHMKYGAWHACIISSLCFGCFHMNIQQLIYTFVGGIFMSMVALKTGSLIPTMIIHAMVNLISYLQTLSITLIDNYGALLNGTDMLPTGSPAALVFYAVTTAIPWLLMLVGALMLVVEIVGNRSSFTMPKGDSGLTTAEKATALLSTPAVWLTIFTVASVIFLVES